MTEKPFEFIIRRPIREIDSDKSRQIISICAKYPTFVYACLIDPWEKMAEQSQIKLAVSELKVNLIREISNAEFKFEEEA
jgi:hypothetical protein